MAEPRTASAPSPDVDAYLAELPDDRRELLQSVRDAIRAAVPDADEALSYGMPGYRIGKTAVIFFAAWKAHWSLHDVGPDAVKGLKIAPGIVEKDTVRFGWSAPAPLELVAELARRRAAASRARH